jgi:hypothetical protein
MDIMMFCCACTGAAERMRPAFLDAVNDALRPLGATAITEIPIRPDAVLRALGRVLPMH